MRAYVSCLLFSLVTALLIPISAEAQVIDVDCVAIIDSGGARVARTELIDDFQVRVFHIEHNGFAVPFRLISQEIYGTRNEVRFTDTACSSAPFVNFAGNLTPSPTSAVIGQDVYYAEPSSVGKFVAVQSEIRTDTGSCKSSSDPAANVVPALHHFTIPSYTPPFTIEPEPCSTPPDPEQFINGCISKNGTLKIVADPADCSSRETPITLLGP